MKFSEKFIKATNEMCNFDNFVNAPYLRKKFSLDFKPQNAEITICGLGFYELYINGQNITKGPLAPYISNTDHICYYDNYDISDLLEKGENVIGILLGNGFRNPFGGFIWDFEKSPHRGTPTVALSLEASDKDNSIEIEADTSFKVHPSPIIFDDERMGCRYDARLEIPDWCLVDYDDSDWDDALYEKKPKGIAKLCTVEPIAVTNRMSPVEVKHYDSLPFAYKEAKKDAEPFSQAIRDNVYIYDFGVNTAGVTELRIKNTKPGQIITIRHGEWNIDGKFAVNTTIFNREDAIDKYLEFGQTDVYICKGADEEVFLPKFKYDGFRYAYVEGLEEEQATKDALTFFEMSSDLKERASFECSDEVLNKLQECARRSDLSNFYYFPTDCPHREKNGWTGDATMSAEHMLLNLTAEKSLGEWLTSIRYSQDVYGALPGIVPTGGWGFEWGNGPAWDAVSVNLPYYIYRFTGNKEVIEENVPMIMKYLCYVMSRRNEKGLIAIGLGDWLDPFEAEKGYISSPLEFTDTAMIYDMAKKASFLFKEIGRNNESEYAKNIADDLYNAIRTELIDNETMTVSGDCQTSQAVALAMGLFKDDELEKARKRLVEIIHRDGDVNACGMIGLRYIYHALTDMDEADLAYKIITSKKRTGYGHWVEQGTTTLWERFDDLEKDSSTSKNHHFFGDISSWFIQEIAGLKPNPEASDTTHFEISPHFIKGLDYAKAEYISPFGKAKTRWERIGEKITVSILLSEGTHGDIILPKGYSFTDGEYKKAIFTGNENKFECVKN